MSFFSSTLSANTSAYGGYSLETALEHVADVGYRRVEIAAMIGLIEHVEQREMNPRNAARVRTLLDLNGLKTVAFSAHLFLNQRDAAELFMQRMDFARGIGATIVNTKTGALSGHKQFMHNMERLVRYAENIGVKIGLETHGDMINHGPEAVQVVKSFASDHVLLNYDFGNVVINSAGTVDAVADFISISDDVGHLHLKDVRQEGHEWHMTAIGRGMVGFTRLFSWLRRTSLNLPMTVDLPLCLVLDAQAGIRRLSPPLSLEDIDRIMADSLDFILGVESVLET